MKQKHVVLGIISLLLSGCQSAMSIANEDGKLNMAEIIKLPEIKRDRSHIQYVDAPNGPLMKFDGNHHLTNPEEVSYFLDYAKLIKVIQLEKSPLSVENDIQWIVDVTQDGDMLFINYSETFVNIRRSAIYDTNGKLIAQLEGAIKHVNKEAKEIICYIEDDLVQYNNANWYNSKYKIYSYKGELICNAKYAARSEQAFYRPNFLESKPYYEFMDKYYVFCDKDNNNKLKFTHSGNGSSSSSGNGDCRLFVEDGDTCWSITEHGAVATTVLRGRMDERARKYDRDIALTTLPCLALAHIQSNIHTPNFDYYFWETPQHYADPEKLNQMGEWTQFGNREGTWFHGRNREGKKYLHEDCMQIFDRKSGKIVYYSTMKSAKKYPRTFMESMSDRVRRTISMNAMDDGKIWSQSHRPIFMKDACAKAMREEKQGEISYPTDKEIEMVHKFKLDGGPILFIMEMGTENIARKNFYDFYKKKGLTEAEIQEMEKQLNDKLKEKEDYEILDL